MVSDTRAGVGSRRPGVLLTGHERELLAVLAWGANVRHVAGALGVPEEQVRTALASALGKLGARSGPEVGIIALGRGDAARAGSAGTRGETSGVHRSHRVRGGAGAGRSQAVIALKDGRMLPRIPYFPLPREPLEALCGACGVTPGALHRRGCEREACPACGDRLGGCGCTS